MNSLNSTWISKSDLNLITIWSRQQKRLIAKVELEGYDKRLVVYVPRTLGEKKITKMAAACRLLLAQGNKYTIF